MLIAISLIFSCIDYFFCLNIFFTKTLQVAVYNKGEPIERVQAIFLYNQIEHKADTVYTDVYGIAKASICAYDFHKADGIKISLSKDLHNNINNYFKTNEKYKLLSKKLYRFELKNN